MNRFLILLFCCLAGVLAHPRCFGRGSAKVEDIPEGCHIANLTITTRSLQKIIDGKTLCNNKVHHKTFDYKFERVSFQKLEKKEDPDVRVSSQLYFRCNGLSVRFIASSSDANKVGQAYIVR